MARPPATAPGAQNGWQLQFTAPVEYLMHRESAPWGYSDMQYSLQ